MLRSPFSHGEPNYETIRVIIVVVPFSDLCFIRRDTSWTHRWNLVRSGNPITSLKVVDLVVMSLSFLISLG
jgi:hypothetical protein